MNKIKNKAHLLLSINLLVLTITLTTPLLFWVSLLVFVSVAIRLALYLGLHNQLPNNRTINLLALLAAIVLAWFGWQMGLLLSMINLLVIAGSLKLIMMRKVRDFFLLVLVQIFIIGCGFIFHQSILFALLYGTSLLVILLCLAIHASPGKQWNIQIYSLTTMVLQAIPVTILLFLVLPQIAPLWQMPTQKGAKTGIEDEITPGDFAHLSQSDELVFRATFEGDIPAKSSLYWRTIVYEEFDGKTWSLSKARERQKQRMQLGTTQFNPKTVGNHVYYDVIMEPTQQNRLYVLDVAKSPSSETWMSTDYLVQSRIPITSKYKYEVYSYPETLLNQGSKYVEQQINLQVPKSGNPMAREWVNSLRLKHPNDTDFINAVEMYLRKNNFVYTLNPPVMPASPVDAFLFTHRAGFCSHYASAFAYVMRLAGIPARIVGGYQGGESRENNYISVHQYDAHAWVEIYSTQYGWMRKDPTALVSPDRISLGLESAVAYENSFLKDSPLSLNRLKIVPMFNQLRLLIADIDFVWSNWVLGYDQQRQISLFRRMVGEITPTRVALLSLAAFAVIVLLLTLYNYRVWFPKIADEALHHYQQVLSVLARHGYTRSHDEGPEGFYQRINQHLKESCAEDFRHITRLFVLHQYAGEGVESNERLAELRSAARRFKRRYRFSLK